MLKKITLTLAILALVAAPVLASSIVDKDGRLVQLKPASENDASLIRTDWEYNTGGSIDFIPTSQGSNTGWGEWFITTVYNDSGQDLYLTELGFPCTGPPTSDFGWLVWTNVGGIVPPAGNAFTAEYHGAFTPVEPDPSVNPRVYTYVDVSDENIVIVAGTYFCFGYDNTGLGGQTTFNGVQTWAWYSGLWDPDEGWGRTAILQVKADFDEPVTSKTSTWGGVKALFH